MVVVETTGSVTTRVRFLALILTSLGSKSGTPFYLNHRNRVNTFLRFCEKLFRTEEFRRGRRNVHARPRALRRNQRCPQTVWARV